MMFLALLSCSTFAQERYVSDKLFTYLHAGPSNQFRIIGSINAGEKVTLLASNSETGYSQISDAKGRKGWMETRLLTKTVGMAERFPKLEKELAETKQQLATVHQEVNKEKTQLLESIRVRDEKIADLEQGYSDINQQFLASKNEVRELRAKLDGQKEQRLLQYFMYGGGVAGGGLLFGLLLPYLLPSRKRNPGGWS